VLYEPSRWWVPVAVGLFLAVGSLVRAALRAPYVVHMTFAQFVGSLFFYIGLVGWPAFLGGALWTEHRRRTGRPNRLLGGDEASSHL